MLSTKFYLEKNRWIGLENLLKELKLGNDFNQFILRVIEKKQKDEPEKIEVIKIATSLFIHSDGAKEALRYSFLLLIQKIWDNILGLWRMGFI